MVKEAEEHKAEDDKRKEQAELKNKAEGFIAQIDQSLPREVIKQMFQTNKRRS